VSTVGFGILQSSKSQAPNPKEAPSTKLQNDRPLMLDKGSVVPGRPSCARPLGFETWSLFGAWGLELGAFYQPTHSKSVARAKTVTSHGKDRAPIRLGSHDAGSMMQAL